MIAMILKQFRSWLPLGFVWVVGTLLRVYAIDRLPPGLFGDEAVEGLDALDVLAGNFNIWFHAHLGREPIYVYLDAISYMLFGITPLATRLPAILAGILTIPAAYWLVREWSAQLFDHARSRRLALLTTALLAISFWHIQMTRNAHRDTLLPLVEAIGYALFWRAIRTRQWKFYALSGAILGLAIYTYSPGRFVGVFVGLFVALEFIIGLLNDPRPRTEEGKPNGTIFGHRSSVIGLGIAGLVAVLIMLPLGIYFAQNPAQFMRRFDSTSVMDKGAPLESFTSSAIGNTLQFFVPDAGYQSKHYNLPGKPIFDLLIAPWFLAGIVIALTRIKKGEYRFLLLWYGIMLIPAFLTSDMIPKAVRVLGVVPGVFIFPALAMDWLIERAYGGTLTEAISSTNRARLNRMELALPNPFIVTMVSGLIAITFIGSAIWTTHDYFVAFANMPELPLAFDADQTEVAQFFTAQPSTQPVYYSHEVYRPPTLMLLGMHVPTSRYVDRATRFKEMDARTTLIANPDAMFVFIRDRVPSDVWRERLAPQSSQVGQGNYFIAYKLGALGAPQKTIDVSFNPYLKLVGYSRYNDEPQGLVLYWQVIALPHDRTDAQMILKIDGTPRTQGKRMFGVSPLEWNIGDTLVEWYEFEMPNNPNQFTIEIKRGAEIWESSSMIFN